MESKKNVNKDGAKFRTMFLHIGFIVAISLTITAFEWKFEEVKVDLKIPVEVEKWTPPIIASTDHKLPEPPKPVSNSTEIEAVDDDTQLPTEIFDDLKPEPKTDDSEIIDMFDDVEVVVPPIVEVFIVAEKDAVPVNGLNNWYSEISEYCSVNYPKRDIKVGNQGKVYVSFIVEKDGSLTDIRVTKSISKTLDKVAIDAVRKSGKWKPARQGGLRVRLIKNLPIKFNL